MLWVIGGSVAAHAGASYLLKSEGDVESKKKKAWMVVGAVTVVLLGFVMANMGPSYYSELGTHPKASVGDIRKAKKLKLFEVHPDKNKDESATDDSIRINEIVEILSDQETRYVYDRFGPTFIESGNPITMSNDLMQLCLLILPFYVAAAVVAYVATMQASKESSRGISFLGLAIMFFMDLYVRFSTGDALAGPLGVIAGTSLYPTQFQAIAYLQVLFLALMNGYMLHSSITWVDREKELVDVLIKLNDQQSIIYKEVRGLMEHLTSSAASGSVKVTPAAPEVKEKAAPNAHKKNEKKPAAQQRGTGPFGMSWGTIIFFGYILFQMFGK